MATSHSPYPYNSKVRDQTTKSMGFYYVRNLITRACTSPTSTILVLAEGVSPTPSNTQKEDPRSPSELRDAVDVLPELRGARRYLFTSPITQRFHTTLGEHHTTSRFHQARLRPLIQVCMERTTSRTSIPLPSFANPVLRSGSSAKTPKNHEGLSPPLIFDE